MAGFWISLISILFGLAVNASETGFDVNDVSILFALKEDQTHAIPDIALSLKTQSGELLSKNLFEEIVRKTQAVSENRNRIDYSKWRIIALRYDPCAPLFEKGPACQAELRLVTQPISPTGGFDDFAMHLIYELQPAEQGQVIQALREIQNLSQQIQAPTQGKTLQPHPGLITEMQKGSSGIQKRLFNLIRQFTGEKKLTDLTTVDADPQMSGPWFFIGGKIKNGQWEIEKIPLMNGSKVQSLDDMGLSEELPSSPMAIFMGGLVGRNVRQNPLTEKEIEALYVVQNPFLSHSRNTDCASCHVASIRTLDYSKGSQQQTRAFQMPFGVTGFAENRFAPERESNTRVFGYFLDQATITPLVANSSAAVAAKINQEMGWTPPTSRNCQASEVQDCFLKLGKWRKLGGSEKVCLALCSEK